MYFVESLRNAFWGELWLLVQSQERAVTVDRWSGRSRSVTAPSETPPAESALDTFMTRGCTQFVHSYLSPRAKPYLDYSEVVVVRVTMNASFLFPRGITELWALKLVRDLI